MRLLELLEPGDVHGQCVALAGLFQAVAQVQACARSGSPSNAAAVQTSVLSVLCVDPPDAESVFGSLARVRPGLETLLHHVDRQMNALRLEQARYAASLMYLERRLAAAPAIAARLGSALTELAATREAADGGDDGGDEWLHGQLAGLYVNHISTLGPRIMVSGEPLHLKSEENANRIRALLLAGLRAAVLWRQCGGNRFRLGFYRGRLRQEITAIRKLTPL